LYTSYEFTHQFDPTFTGTSLSTVSGMAIVPKGEGPFPLVFMVRGYVDPTIYSTGVGTHRAAEFFASHGFLTIAPDFLGYADSTTEAGNVFESRFQTYTTALSVLQSVSSLSQWDHKHIFLWAHSNGGQIALTLLEVTGKDYPTVLWAPVTKPFPYSVLYYTDESADQGKFLRQETAKFESVYDASFYSLTTYMDRIVAPIQLHQGTADDAVPYDWSQSFVSRLKSLKKDVTFFTYPGADHNLQPDWSTVVQRDLDFYQKYLSI
jgi:alpha-beta hydrolase superfamily lysophospholipase